MKGWGRRRRWGCCDVAMEDKKWAGEAEWRILYVMRRTSKWELSLKGSQWARPLARPFCVQELVWAQQKVVADRDLLPTQPTILPEEVFTLSGLMSSMTHTDDITVFTIWGGFFMLFTTVMSEGFRVLSASAAAVPKRALILKRQTEKPQPETNTKDDKVCLRQKLVRREWDRWWGRLAVACEPITGCEPIRLTTSLWKQSLTEKFL